MAEDDTKGLTPGSGKCKKELMKILTSKIGHHIAKSIIFQKMQEYEIDDLDKASEYIQKVLIESLFSHNLLKIMDRSELQSLKLVLFTKLYGVDKAREFLFDGFYIKTKIPVDYLKNTFGEALGDRIIDMGEKKFSIKNIRHHDEAYQVFFMEEIFKIIFHGFPTAFCDRIRFAMAKFVKLGDTSEEDSLKNLLGKFSVPPEDFMKKVLKNFESFSNAEDMKNMTTNDWLDFLSKLTKDDKSKVDLFHELKKLTSPSKSDSGNVGDDVKNQNIITDLKVILGDFMAMKDAESVIKYSMGKMRIKKLTEHGYNPGEFIDDIVENSIIKEFSPNKVSIVKDKLRAVLK